MYEVLAVIQEGTERPRSVRLGDRDLFEAWRFARDFIGTFGDVQCIVIHWDTPRRPEAGNRAQRH